MSSLTCDDERDVIMPSSDVKAFSILGRCQLVTRSLTDGDCCASIVRRSSRSCCSLDSVTSSMASTTMMTSPWRCTATPTTSSRVLREGLPDPGRRSRPVVLSFQSLVRSAVYVLRKVATPWMPGGHRMSGFSHPRMRSKSLLICLAQCWYGVT